MGSLHDWTDKKHQQQKEMRSSLQNKSQIGTPGDMGTFRQVI